MVGDLYTSAMVSAGIEKIGNQPIQPELDRIHEIQDVSGILREISVEYTAGLHPLFDFYTSTDDKNSNWEMAHFDHGGLGLPNRDYYFRNDSSTVRIRKAYSTYNF